MTKPITLLVCTALSAPALFAQSPDVHWPGQLAFDQAGTVVEVIGDCDADGTPDIAIGAPHADHAITFPIPFTLDDVGHVQVRSGATGAVLFNLWGTAAGEEFGFALADAGDVDQDGHDDLLIGAPRATFNKDHQGKVQVRSGATGVLMRTNWGPQSECRFGHAVAGKGETSSSAPAGYYVVGAPLFDADDSTGGYGQEGLVRKLSGASGVKITDYVGGSEGGGYCTCYPSQYAMDVKHLGWSLGYDGEELAMGAPQSDRRNTDTGAVQSDTGYISLERPGGVGSHAHKMRFWGDPGDRAGTALALRGALIAIGFPGIVGDGRVMVLRHDWTGFTPKLFDWYAVTGTPQKPVGEVLSFVGNFDNDEGTYSTLDLAIGSPNTQLGFPIGTAGVGSVAIRSGEDGALLTEYYGTSANDLLGSAVAGADFNNDGFSDLVLGVPGHDTISGVNSGAAWYYDGNPCPAASLPYGTGHPGTNGTPEFLHHSVPKLGSTYVVGLTNSLGAPTQAWLFVGLAPAALPIKGATLLVDPILSLAVPMGSGTLPLNPALPDDPALCGVSLFVQGLVIDPGASHGVAFSRGLEMRLGY